VVLIKLRNTTNHSKRPSMNLAYLNTPEISFFSEANNQLSSMISHLGSESCKNKEHADIEKYIQLEGFELLRRLFQGYLLQLESFINITATLSWFLFVRQCVRTFFRVSKKKLINLNNSRQLIVVFTCLSHQKTMSP